MSSAPYDLSISAARAGALFASPLQRSDEPSASQVRRAIAAAGVPAAGVHHPDMRTEYRKPTTLTRTTVMHGVSYPGFDSWGSALVGE